MNNVHPGVVLKQKFMSPLNLSSTKLAKYLNLSPSTICELVRERRDISNEIALKLSHYFATPISYWSDLFLAYEAKRMTDNLEKIQKEKRLELQELQKEIKKELSEIPSMRDNMYILRLSVVPIT